MNLYKTAMVNVSATEGTPSYVRVAAIICIIPITDSSGFSSRIELSTGTTVRSPLTVPEIAERMDRAVELAHRHS